MRLFNEGEGVGAGGDLDDADELDKALDLLDDLMTNGGLSEDEAVAKVAEQYPDLMDLIRTLVVGGTDEAPQDAVT